MHTACGHSEPRGRLHANTWRDRPRYRQTARSRSLRSKDPFQTTRTEVGRGRYERQVGLDPPDPYQVALTMQIRQHCKSLNTLPYPPLVSSEVEGDVIRFRYVSIPRRSLKNSYLPGCLTRRQGRVDSLRQNRHPTNRHSKPEPIGIHDNTIRVGPSGIR